MLLARGPECARIASLLARARAGTSCVLVLRGEAGIGKTSLLDFAARSVEDATVLRARGVESEIAMPFAALDELLRGARGIVDLLPEPQAVALRGALGLGSAATPERHLVGVATLAALSMLAEERPLLVLVDDIQWLDGPSATALLFAARRLLADSVLVLLAARAGEATVVDGAGFDELVVEGLGVEDARELLARRAGRPVAAETAAWLHAATAGNPLALTELAGDAPRLPPGPIGDPVPVGERTAQALGRRLDRLPEAAAPALLAAAVADADDLEPVLRAAAALGGSLSGLEAAESAGLVHLGPGRVAFDHPLVRSAVLDRVGPWAVRAAHRAYAAGIDPAAPADADRQIWHEAAGRVEPDETVAAALAGVGTRAARRGGYASAAAALERAARLTPTAARAGERLRDAGEAAWLAGDGPGALALLEDASSRPLEPAVRAAAEHVRGRVLARRGPVPLAVSVLRDAAEATAARAPALAAEMLAEASVACVYGSLGSEMDEIARRAVALAPAGDARAQALATTALGAARVLRNQPDAAERLREAALQIAAAPHADEDMQLAAFLGIQAAYRRAPQEEYAPLQRAVALARERGAVGILPFALLFLGAGALGSSRWTEAAAIFAEAVRLAEEADLPVDGVASLAGLARLEARRGEVDAATRHAATVIERAGATGMPFFEAWALHALGDLAWARDDVAAAVDAFERKAQVLAGAGLGDPDLSPVPELVEAHLRLDDPARATALAGTAVAAAEAKGRPWALARATRTLALVEPDDRIAAEIFAAALELHAEEPDAFEHARTSLCFGERLRRGGRRADARDPLRDALEAFEGLGAAPWADRARDELAATGERVRRRDPSSVDELTPQELRIALMLADGSTTRQTAAALYLSPKTVEYHLRHVYLKLGVNSRAALATALAAHNSSASRAAARPAPPSSTDR